MRRNLDNRGLWAWRVASQWEKLQEKKDNFRNYLLAQFWGVKIGSKCRFWGKTYFSRAPNSQIVIGEACRFRSAAWSNKVGLTRPCMISTLYPGAKIIIGSGVGMSGTVVAAAESIIIGNDVMCGGNVTITDTDWHSIEPDRRNEPGPAAPVVIEDNVWLGLNTIVIKGVTIGRDCVIGAGSVVTQSIPPRVIAAGQPAKVITNIL
jgi:acetyltransferase-like isoleucine patch superfamily enzyme